MFLKLYAEDKTLNRIVTAFVKTFLYTEKIYMHAAQFARDSLEDYTRVLYEAKEINPKMDIIITGREALTSPLTIAIAKYNLD